MTGVTMLAGAQASGFAPPSSSRRIRAQRFFGKAATVESQFLIKSFGHAKWDVCAVAGGTTAGGNLR